MSVASACYTRNRLLGQSTFSQGITCKQPIIECACQDCVQGYETFNRYMIYMNKCINYKKKFESVLHQYPKGIEFSLVFNFCPPEILLS